jgi:hypothetical protein
VLSQAQEIAERRLAQADARMSDAERQAADRLEQADRQVQIKLVDADQQASRLFGAGEDEAAQRLTRVDAIAEQVLFDARQNASRRRARAEDDADRMLLLARTRYEDIVVRAHQRADRAAEVALAEIQHPITTTPGGGRVRAELEMKAAYLRTFAKVSRAALQAALDVTAREFDRLLGDSASREAMSAGPIRYGPAPSGPAPVIEPVIAAPRTPAHAAHSAQAPHVQPRVIVLPDTEAAQLAQAADDLATVTRLH